MHAHERIDPRRGPGRERDDGRREIADGVTEHEEDREAERFDDYDSREDWGADEMDCPWDLMDGPTGTRPNLTNYSVQLSPEQWIDHARFVMDAYRSRPDTSYPGTRDGIRQALKTCRKRVPAAAREHFAAKRKEQETP